MDAEIIRHPAIHVVDLHYRGKNENETFPAVRRAFWPRHLEIDSPLKPIHSYGLIDHFDPDTRDMDYLAGIAVNPECAVPQGMTKLDIPPQTYAVFQCTLPTLWETIGVVHEQWFPGSGYRRADGLEFELYDQRFDSAQGKLEMSVWIPVVRDGD